MTIKEALRPLKHARVIDLVREAGVDVSDWANFAKGERHAGANPKYCYEWSFVDPAGPTVLSLWHEELIEDHNGISHRSNFRPEAYVDPDGKTAWKLRAYRLDLAVAAAWRDHRPIRAMFNAGNRRQKGDASQRSAQVKVRLLDPEPWHVAWYDPATGEHELRRGGQLKLVDQFTSNITDQQAERRRHLSTSYVRRREVREAVLKRSKGFCEFCGDQGFELPDGSRYLETHHIIALSKSGVDHLDNVIALCANDHRKAHYGKNAHEITQRLVEISSAKRTATR